MSKMAEAMRETAQDLYDAGVMSKFTLRQIEELSLEHPEELTAEEIKELRLECQVSQPVFARYLIISVDEINGLPVKTFPHEETRLKGLAILCEHTLGSCLGKIGGI